MIHEGQYKCQVQQADRGHKQDSDLAELHLLHQLYDFSASGHVECWSLLWLLYLI